MKAIVWSMIVTASLGACAVTDREQIGETEQGVFGNDVFYDKFDPLALGSIDGQAGWSGNCSVVSGLQRGDRNLACSGSPALQNGQGAQHTFARPPNRNYHLQFDVWTDGVTDATHGKVFLENAPGDGSTAILQIAIGCTGIRGTFEYHGTTTRPLMPGHDCVNGPHYRVACIWHDGGNAFRCGASTLPADPDESQFVTIPATDDHGNPESIGPFDRIRVLGGIGFRLGTTTFDKVQVLSD